MSDAAHTSDQPGSDDERRVTSALAAFGAQVRPDPEAWDQIDARLRSAPARRFARRGGVTTTGSGRRLLLVAAAFVAVVLVAGAVAMRARTAGTEVELATAPPTQSTLAILAVTNDGRLVELGTDGTEQREIYRPPAGQDPVGQLTGPIAVSETDGVVYAERSPRDRCGDEAALAGRTDVTAFPELVAIPIDGGDVRVIAAAGDHPTYLPGRNWLAYVKPANGQTCSAALDAPDLEVLDLSTGDRGSYSVSAGMVGESTASGSAAVGETPDAIVPLEGSGSSMTPGVVDLRWSSGGSSLFALVQLSRRAVPAFVDRLTFGDAVGTTTARDMTFNLGGIMPDGPMPAGSALYAETLAPYGGEDRFLVAGVVRDYSGSTPDEDIATADVLLHIYDTTLQPRDGDPVGTEVDLELATPGGASPVMLGSLDRDPATGRLLLLFTGTGPVVVPAPDGITSDIPYDGLDEAGFVSRLVVWNGDTPTEIGKRYRAAAWFRRSGGASPTPIDTIDSSMQTTVPPGAGTTSTSVPVPTTEARSTTVPYPSTTTVPVDVVGTSERPDDAALIVGAFEAFFEQGDRGALEGSGVLEPAFEEGEKTVPGGGQGVTVTVDAISFTGPGSAEVRFRLDKDGNFFTATTDGSAVFVDGRWKVSAATMCTLLSRVSIPCPALP